MGTTEAAAHGERIRRAVQHRHALSGDVNDSIMLSWERCMNDYGLQPESRRLPPVLSRAELLERHDCNQTLINEAKQEMNILYQQLADPELAVVLVDMTGTVLHMVAASQLEDDLLPMGLRTGAVWSEEHAGTNGMGTCLATADPIVIQQADHFFSSHTQLTCSAVPITDQDGEIVAALDVTSRSTLLQQHSLVLIGFTARMIENRLLDVKCEKAHPIHFHSRPESIYTVHGGKLMVDDDGTIVTANRSALFQLGFSTMAELRRHRFEDIFQSTLENMLRRSLQSSFHPVPIYRTRASNRFFAIAQHPKNSKDSDGKTIYPTVTPTDIVVPANPLVRRGAQGQRTSARAHPQVELGDSTLNEQFALASRVVARAVPVLLYGETGSGKEVFAQALHNESASAEGPFIAVNCASLPESLIESELFGYQAGAFTGAHRQGRRGKIQQADKGTLFLDEIGDMPLSLQARLLRVLDERKVTPLGSETSIKVDFQLISASHRNLTLRVSDGLFREDLYYRLNGVEVRLPALRDREDKRALIFSILEEEEGGPVRLSAQAEDVLLRYSWPGNLRQLRHVLRTMTVLANGDLLDTSHIPDTLQSTSSVPSITYDAQQAQEPAKLTHADALPRTPEDNDFDQQALDAPDQEPNDPSLDALNQLEISERETLIRLLGTHRWNVTRVAKTLEISRNTLYRKLHRLSIPLVSQTDRGRQ